VWCSTHLYCCFVPNMDDRPNYPLMIQQWYQGQCFDEEFNRLLVSKVFLTKVVRRQVLLSAVNGGASIIRTWGEDCCGKCDTVRWVNCLTLLKKVYVEDFISDKTRKSNILEFWVKRCGVLLTYHYRSPIEMISDCLPITQQKSDNKLLN
jgi:hypothetical protein